MGLKAGGVRGSLRNVSTGVGAIPDSEDLHARYDFREYSGTSNFSDLTGNGYDLTNGSITGTTESINGNQAGEFDKTDDSVDTGTFTSVSTPYTIFAVARVDNPDDFHTIADLVDGANGSISYDNADTDWFWNSGTGGLHGGSASEMLITVRVSDSGDTILRTDGVERAAVNNPENAMDIVRLGERGGVGWWFGGAIGEVLVYENDKSSKFSDVENYLANGWGITI